MIWAALMGPPTVPQWHGPRRECHPLDRKPEAPQPKVAPEPWEAKKRQPRKWVAWSLLRADAPAVPAPGVAECWPLLEVSDAH